MGMLWLAVDVWYLCRTEDFQNLQLFNRCPTSALCPIASFFFDRIGFVCFFFFCRSEREVLGVQLLFVFFAFSCVHHPPRVGWRRGVGLRKAEGGNKSRLIITAERGSKWHSHTGGNNQNVIRIQCCKQSEGWCDVHSPGCSLVTWLYITGN